MTEVPQFEGLTDKLLSEVSFPISEFDRFAEKVAEFLQLEYGDDYGQAPIITGAGQQDSTSPSRGGQVCETPAKECVVWGVPHITSLDLAGDGKSKYLALCFYGDGSFCVERSTPVQTQDRGGRGCETPAKECAVWGVPHITSFDLAGTVKHKALSFCGNGSLWVERSTPVQIQVRGGQGCETQAKERAVWSVPHITSFDLAGTVVFTDQAPSFCGNGSFWVERSTPVQTQGAVWGVPHIPSFDQADTGKNKNQALSSCGDGSSGRRAVRPCRSRTAAARASRQGDWGS